jgi:hypothetical protein
MALRRVPRGECEEEVQDPARLRAPVTVVAEEDDERGGEGVGGERGLEVGADALQLRDVAVDVTHADHRAGKGERRRVHLAGVASPRRSQETSLQAPVYAGSGSVRRARETSLSFHRPPALPYIPTG